MRRRHFISTFGAAGLVLTAFRGRPLRANNLDIPSAVASGFALGLLILLILMAFLTSLFRAISSFLGSMQHAVLMPLQFAAPAVSLVRSVQTAFDDLGLALAQAMLGIPAAMRVHFRQLQNFQRTGRRNAQSATRKAEAAARKLEQVAKSVDRKKKAANLAIAKLKDAKKKAEREVRENRSKITAKDEAAARKKADAAKKALNALKKDLDKQHGAFVTAARQVQRSLKTVRTHASTMTGVARDATSIAKRMGDRAKAGDANAVKAAAGSVRQLDARGAKADANLKKAMEELTQALQKLFQSDRQFGLKMNAIYGRASRDTGVRFTSGISF